VDVVEKKKKDEEDTLAIFHRGRMGLLEGEASLK